MFQDEVMGLGKPPAADSVAVVTTHHRVDEHHLHAVRFNNRGHLTVRASPMSCHEFSGTELLLPSNPIMAVSPTIQGC